MKDRCISNNLRLVLDLIDYSDLITDDESFILFLDFCKAFDNVEHTFLFYCLEKMGFGDYLCSAVKTLYANGNSSVKLSAGTTRRFCLQRGIRQGCPVSVYLFLLVAQVFCRYIKSSNIDGISIAGKNILISQLADDTTLFLKNSSQVPRVLQVIETFSKASGLYLNLKKCELFPLKQCALTSINSIVVKDKVTYLGLQITKDQKQRELMNYNPMIAKAQNRFNRLLQRDLSIKGCALLAKAEGISSLVYIASSLSLDGKTAKRIDQILFNFLWRNRIHYVRKSVVINSSKNGGLDFLDFSTLNNVLKIKWLKNFLKSETSFWSFIPKYIFDKLGGLPFLLICNFKIEKIPLKLSS
uniref:Reverse transcriptase domain-containing protein n=1 Tax=Oryzias sinensis TaxID=183150 RepID=A0A8C7XSJ8_9TELE